MPPTPGSSYDAFTADAGAPAAQPSSPTPDVDALEASFSDKPALATMPPQSGGAADSVWSAVQGAGSAAARILSKTGYGAENAWGADPYDFGTERQKLVKSGALDEYDTGHQGFVKGATEFLLRNAVILGNLPSQALRAPGAIIGGVSAGAEEAGQEIEGKNPNAAQSALAYPLKSVSELTADPNWMFGLGVGSEEHTASTTGATLAAREAENLNVSTKARATGALGEGEAGYYDAVQPSPQNLEARQASAQEADIEVPPPEPAPDIHVLARRVDPDTFEQFDAAAEERDQHRQTIAQLGEAREQSPEVAEARAQVETILGKVNGVESRLTNVAAERLASAQERLQSALTTDTPEMTQARQALMQADFKMRDLAPDVSEAYRQAAEMAPELANPEAPKLGEKQLPGEQPTEPQPGAAEGPPTGAGPNQVSPAAVEASGEASGVANTVNVLGKQKLGEIGGSSGEEGTAENADTPGTAGRGAQPQGEATPAASPVKTTGARYGNLKAVEGTGELRTRGLAEGVEAKAIEDGLTETFGDLPEYQQLSMADQASKVKDLMDADYDTAKEIALGNRQPPKGIFPESVYVGVEKRALAENDVDTLRKLATESKLTTSATTMGQRIRTLGERDRTSPVGLIQEVQAAREAALAERSGSSVEAAKREVVNQERPALREEVKSATRQRAGKVDAWNSFIDSIKC